MSLRAFHIFFISVSVLFAFGFGWWGLHTYFQHTERALMLWLGLIAFAVGGILIVYGIKVFQKLMKL